MKRKYVKKIKSTNTNIKVDNVNNNEKPKTDKVDKIKKVIIVRFDD